MLSSTRCNDVAFYALTDKDLTFFEYMGRIFRGLFSFFFLNGKATGNLDQVPWTEVTFISGVEIFMDDIRYWGDSKKNLQQVYSGSCNNLLQIELVLFHD